MSFAKTIGMVLFLASTSICSGIGHAGFDASYLGQSSDNQQPPNMVTPKIEKKSDAPALQIFQDRYVPDSVRKKYALEENWYEKGAQETKEPLPLSITQDDARDDMIAPEVRPLPSQEIKPMALVESWRARKGENLRDILRRWSERSNANLMWATPDLPVLEKDFSFFGKYQDAVNAIIKETGGDKIHSQYRSEGMNPVMMTPAATVTTNSPPVIEDTKESKLKEDKNIFSRAFEPAPVKEREQETRWFGLSGAPLAEVIQVWADDADVKLIWQSEKNFALKESVSHVGQFEDAVFRALSQYDADIIRPVGEVYHDPRTGQRVLLVRTDVK